MSNSPLAVYTKISPNKTKNRNHKIDTITIHCVVGQCSVERIGQIFANILRRASSNYGVGSDGRIGMYVEEKDRSWCSSNKANDHRAITIECASDTKHPYAIKDDVYISLIELCTDICKRNGKKKLLWFGDKTKTLNYTPADDEMIMTVHRWFKNKACPGDYIYERLDDIAKQVTKKLGSKEETKTTVPKDAVYTMTAFIKDVQKAVGAKVDGKAGPETLSKTVTVSAKKNPKHAVVKPIQKRLKALGYTEVGTADGVAGAKFTKAVKRYQKNCKCTADGEITATKKTWRKLLGME